MKDEAVKLAHHMGLMTGMARKTGADLAHLVQEEDGLGSLREALVNCTRCSAPGPCGDWQERTMDGAGSPPPYCRNADLMDRLAGKDRR